LLTRSRSRNYQLQSQEWAFIPPPSREPTRDLILLCSELMEALSDPVPSADLPVPGITTW